MNTFLKSQAERAKRALGAGFFNKPKPAQEVAAQRASTESKLNDQIIPEAETKPDEKITSVGVSQLFKSFQSKLPNSKNGAGVDSPQFLPTQSTQQPEDKTEESNQKTSKLTYFQAQFKKYVCSFKSQIYSGQNQTLMSEAEEAKAIMFAIQLFICLTQFLAPALREFLATKKLLPRNSTIDGYKYLKTMLKMSKQNANFLSPGGGKGLDLQYVQTAFNGRNAVCHGVLPDILAEWHKFLHSWIELCYLINAPEAAKAIKLVHDRLIAEEEQNNPKSPPVPVTVTIENLPVPDPQQDDQDEPVTPTG
jgi:hypothetical protein